MPSASTKADVQTSQEVLDPIKKVLNVVDKKVRNLEKRKLKLDSYKEKQESGECLEKDQQVAVDRYGEVIQNLEFARDLQKQFNMINVDSEKVMKKQAKREKLERQVQECKRVREILQFQGLLDSLGSDNVRQDFQTGKHGAIVLTEENLDQLDELYKLICPTREGEVNYHESLSHAADHIVSLLDGKDKAVVGTTYKELKELLDLIAECGYFEHAQQGDEETKEEVTEQEFEVVLHEDVPAPESEEVQSSLPPEILQEPEVGVIPQTAQLSSDDEASLDVQTQQVGNLPAEADSFFSANTQTVQQQQEAAMASHAAVFQRQRPFQEIVSEVQGSFNFLQESTIDMECKREFSPHMDPAVVAAHPMPTASTMARPPSTHTPESLSQSGFGASSYGEQQTLDSDPQSVDPSIISQQTVTTAQSQDFTNSSFGQSARTQTIQSDNMFSNAVSDSSSGTMAHKVLGQSGTDSSLSQYEIPPSIPLPPGHESSQDSQQSQGEKKPASFHMNPNANVFQSQLYSESQGGAEEEDNTEDKSNDTSSFQGGTFTNSTSNYQQSRDNQRGGRGGFRGGDRDRGERGGRGRGGGGGMSNGYSRGGGRGGDRNYSSNYQGGYNQRNDYRSDGYQGYGSGGGYNRDREGGFKRGGPPRGGNRGGPRGGFSRGGGRGGSDRPGTGNRGFGRPNFNQQQTA